MALNFWSQIFYVNYVVFSDFDIETRSPQSNSPSEEVINSVCIEAQIDDSVAENNHKHNSATIDIEESKKIRTANTNNPMISHLNVNHLRNKISEIRELTKRLYPNVLAISETKIDSSFTNAMFTIDEYYNPADFRKDRDGNGGGLLIDIKEGTPCKRLKSYEEANIESIYF